MSFLPTAYNFYANPAQGNPFTILKPGLKKLSSELCVWQNETGIKFKVSHVYLSASIPYKKDDPLPYAVGDKKYATYKEAADVIFQNEKYHDYPDCIYFWDYDEVFDLSTGVLFDGSQDHQKMENLNCSKRVYTAVKKHSDGLFDNYEGVVPLKSGEINIAISFYRALTGSTIVNLELRHPDGDINHRTFTNKNDHPMFLQ